MLNYFNEALRGRLHLKPGMQS